jgi:hypothetical protein
MDSGLAAANLVEKPVLKRIDALKFRSLPHGFRWRLHVILASFQLRI